MYKIGCKNIPKIAIMPNRFTLFYNNIWIMSTVPFRLEYKRSFMRKYRWVPSHKAKKYNLGSYTNAEAASI